MAEGYRTFGSYILFKEYSSDALGHLYRAGEFDAGGITRTVFLRVLDGPHVPAQEVIESFETGRLVASSLVASNVATGVSYIEHGGVPGLVSDYLQAQPLSAVLDRVRAEGFPVPVDNALLILEKLALALSAALALEIQGAPLVHGCLHPGLILISTDGESLVTGLGIGDRLLGIVEDPDAAEAVRPYLAQEVLPTRTPSKRSDVYSMGAILLELLTGQPPPADPEERLGVLDRARSAYDERPLPDDIKSVLGRAIAHRPEDRFSSAADFKKELDHLLYGGAYSPTTFNLALFMDRLFRADIEAEEEERAIEGAVDPTPYLAPEPTIEPEVVGEEAELERGRRGIWIAAAAAVVAVAIALWVFVIPRPPPEPTAPPTPTAEELEAQRLQQEQRLQEMVQEMVQAKMAEREQEIRDELLVRQARIEDLQKRLQDSERRARESRQSAEEQQRVAELKEQIAAEEEAQRQQQEELEAEHIAAAEEQALEVIELSTPTPLPTESPPEATATPPPTATPRPTATPEVVIPNSFYEPSKVDTQAAVIKEHQVTWPRMALHSRRQGLVIAQATVDADGKVEAVKILRADHEGFGIPQAVTEAVRRYHFKPATKNGVRVKTYATVTVRYRFQPR
jgi:serine/threonine-protein kinase